jgi:hypothetical protein
VNEKKGRFGDIRDHVEIDNFQEMKRHFSLGYESSIELAQVYNLRNFEPVSSFQVIP